MSASIICNERECYLCGKRIGLEKHHIMSGTANRKLSEKYGLWVWLCHDCHTGKGGAQYERSIGDRLKMIAQREFEKVHGHDMWMDLFRKNYL